MKNMTNRRQESVAASELLRALTTLQNNSQCYEEELSFGQQPTHQQHEPTKTMNFQIYMQKKTEPGMVGKGARKSVTPLRDATRQANNHNNHNNYSQKRSQRRSCSPAVNLKGTPPIFKNTITRAHNQKQNQLKNSGQPSQQMSTSKLSYNTRKILTQKEKKGKSYVPIQLRAQELLRQREAKLVKLKKEKEFEQMLKDKECTFQPKIHKSNVNYSTGQKTKSKMNHSKAETSIQQKEQQCERTVRIGPARLNTEPIEPQSNSSEPSESFLEQTINDHSQELPDHPAPSQHPSIHKKYRNDKFNILLDYLH